MEGDVGRKGFVKSLQKGEDASRFKDRISHQIVPTRRENYTRIERTTISQDIDIIDISKLIRLNDFHISNKILVNQAANNS